MTEAKFQTISFLTLNLFTSFVQKLAQTFISIYFFPHLFSWFHKKKKNNALIFLSQINSKHLGIKAKYMKDGANRILFIKDVEITDGQVINLK